MCKIKSLHGLVVALMLLGCTGVLFAGSIPGSAGTTKMQDGPNPEGLFFDVDVHYEAFDGLDATDPLGVTPGKKQYAYILEYVDGNENVGRFDVESINGVAIDATGTSPSVTVNGVTPGTFAPTGTGVVTLTSGNPAARFLYNFFGQSQFGGIGSKTVALVYTASSEHSIGDVIGVVVDNSLSAAGNVIGPVECFGVIQGTVICTECDPSGSVMSMEGIIVVASSGGVEVAATETDKNGQYKFEDLDEGDYTVSVELGTSLVNCSATSVDVTVSCDDTAVANFCVCPAACEQEVCVKVVCTATGEEVPVPKAWVGLCGPELKLWRCVGEDGMRCITGQKVVPGDYHVKVKAPKGYEVVGDDRIEFTLAECEKKEIVFNVCPLPPCTQQACISVVTVDDQGVEQPLEGVEIKLGSIRCKKAGTTDVQGTKCFDDLKPGHYVASIAMPQGYHRCNGEQKKVAFCLKRCETEEIKFVLCPIQSYVCPEKPQFWIDNANLWAGVTLELGYIAYDQPTLLNILSGKELDGSKNCRTKRDMSLKLAKYLTAVKLSILDGADPTDISAVVFAADDFLVSYPPGSNPGGRPRACARDLTNRLHDYLNDRSACEGGDQEDDGQSCGGEDDDQNGEE